MIVFTVGQPGQRAYIRSLGVVRDRRREGIATSLKQRAVDYFGKEGAPEYYSEVHRSNYKMNNLNQKLELRPVGEPGNGKFLLYATKVNVDEN